MPVNSQISLETEEGQGEPSLDFAENPPLTETQVLKGWVRMPDGSRIVRVRMDAATFQWFHNQGHDLAEQAETVLRNYATECKTKSA